MIERLRVIEVRYSGHLAGAVTRGERSPVELVEEALARIGEVQPELNCFTAVWAARAQAEAAEAALAAARGDDLGPLHGVPVAIKDTIDVAGWPTRAGSRAFEHCVPATDHAEVVQALLTGGWQVVGKTVLHELAFGVTGINEWAGTALNPMAPDRIVGGSSSGSAAVVAQGAADFASKPAPTVDRCVDQTRNWSIRLCC